MPRSRRLRDQRRDRVLRLGHRHAVAGRDDDARRVGENLGGALGVDLAMLAVVLVVTGRRLDAEAAGDDRDERAVHRLAHDVRQVRTGRAHERAGDDEQVVVEQEARRRRGPTRVAVEHRDHDRHVAAADRRDQVPAEQQRQHRDSHQQPQLWLHDEPDGQRDERDQRAEVHDVLARQHHRRRLHPRRAA